MASRLARAVLLFLCTCVRAQNLLGQGEGGVPEPPADFLRSVGKIYVVVAVIVIVFLGLALYMWRLDRRLSQLEKQDHAPR